MRKTRTDSENHAIVEYYKDFLRGLQGTPYKTVASARLDELVGWTDEAIVDWVLEMNRLCLSK